MRRLTGAIAGLAVASLATGCLAQSTTSTTRHWDTAPGAVTIQFGSQTFVNHGLVGVGRLPASTRDFNGETLGSFSGMALDIASWKRLPDGSYTATLLTLPDRGPNNVGPFPGTTDYADRVEIHQMTFRPATPAVASPGSAQVVLRPSGGFFLRDSAGRPFTGQDPGAGILTREGRAMPSPASGKGSGRVSLDPEAIARLPDGSFYIGDEYTAGIYLFDREGRQTGTVPPVPALTPRRDGAVFFGAEKAPATGRRPNQGMEGVSVSPDGTRLFAVLQSAAAQDASDGRAETRNNTRVLVYDISRTRMPAAPVGHYVLSLPTVREKADGQPADSTAAQSEALALSNTQFLLLARDGNGRGKGSTTPPAYKSILLVDITGATNLAGTPFEQDVTPVARDGRLVPGVTPVRQAELVNILNPVQLARFGQNLDTEPSNPASLPEKIESMALAPALDPAAPHDVFLFVGSDNDFETADGQVDGQAFDAGLKGAGGKGDNDSLILVYRLTLPASDGQWVDRTRNRR